MSETLFFDVIGHEAVKKGLIHAYQNERLHHALLLCGPSGIGKAMLARAFIQAIFCEESTKNNLKRCRKCSNCIRIAKNTHPDILSVRTDEATLKIELIRDLQSKLAYPPFESERRFVIIEDIHKMKDEAANCLLKTLEEPEVHTTFVLVTSQPQRLLPTITSRCQTIRFAPFDQQTVIDFVKRQGQTESMAHQIAALANGSFGNAMALTSEDMQKELTDAFESILDTRGMLEAFSTAASLKGKKHLSENLLSLLLHYIRDMLILKLSQDEPICLAHYRERMMKRLPHVEVASLYRAAHLVQDIQEAFLGNVNELVAWERLVMGMHGVLFDA